MVGNSRPGNHECNCYKPFLFSSRPKSARVLTILLGATLITEGILNLFVAVTTVKIIKHQYPDFIEEDYFETEGENK